MPPWLAFQLRVRMTMRNMLRAQPADAGHLLRICADVNGGIETDGERQSRSRATHHRRFANEAGMLRAAGRGM